MCFPLLWIAPATEAADECLCCREYLTGNLFGGRSGLAEHGVVADLQLTQFYQGVADGGADQTAKYGGKLDYFFTFAQGLVVLHAETPFGQKTEPTFKSGRKRAFVASGTENLGRT